MKIIIMFLIALYTMSYPMYTWAEDYRNIKELFMNTETGEIVLTKEPCEFIKMGLQGYEFAAYATEQGHANHEGCWRMDTYENMSSVQIYFPEIGATAVYNPKLFKPRSTL